MTWSLEDKGPKKLTATYLPTYLPGRLLIPLPSTKQHLKQPHLLRRTTSMASKGNTLESWEPSPWTAAPNANVADQKAMTSAQAQAARAKSAEVMAALKKGEPGDADRLLVSRSSCMRGEVMGDYCGADWFI
jgi:hypothetical protein